MAITYDFPRPALTVDCVLFSVQDGGLRVLLVKRGKAPFAGRWAFPGGFVDQDEDLEDAVLRELEEETGVSGVNVQQLGAFGTPGRDPRGHTVSVVYLGLVAGDTVAKGSDDATDARWHAAERPPALAFDHAKILKLAVDELRRIAGSSPIGLNALPKTFAFGQLHELYEAVLGLPIEPTSLRRSLTEAGVIVEAPGRAKGVKEARLRFDRKRYAELAREGVLLEVSE